MGVARFLTGGVVCLAVLGCEHPPAAEDAVEVPNAEAEEPSSRGIDFPYRVESACPGEGCSYGTWLACDAVPVYAEAGASESMGESIGAGASFEVETGVVLVEEPGVVAVTRPTPHVSFLSDGLTFQPNDTILVLDYVGEGFFNVWHADSILEVEGFWPWDAFRPSDDYEYGGEVIREGRSGFWVRTSGPPAGWIDVEASAVAAPNALDPDPPRCPQGD